MLDINGALKAIGYGLLVLFFAVGVVKTCGSFTDVKRPEHALKLFIRFALAKAAVTYGLDLMLAVFKIVQGIISTIITQSGLSGSSGTTLPQEIIDKINNVGFWDSIPLWAVTLLGGLFITVLSFSCSDNLVNLFDCPDCRFLFRLIFRFGFYGNRHQRYAGCDNFKRGISGTHSRN